VATYIALLRKEAKSDFGVEFPDFPGCVTAGKTLEEAQTLAREALSFHVDGMIEDGEQIPSPSSTDRIMADPANRTAVVFLVDVETQPKSVRVNVTFAPDVLEKIDFAAAKAHLSRSAFLAEVALARCEASKDADRSASDRPAGKSLRVHAGIGGKTIHRTTLAAGTKKPAKGSPRTRSIKKSRSRRPA
jgi:predicted RNase H-like HicB family nuclease